MKFAVETIDSGRAAFITDDSGSVRIEVTAPSDLRHAWRVAMAVLRHGFESNQ